MVLKEPIFNSLYFGSVCGIERTDFSQLILWEGVEALKEPPFYSFYSGRVWWS